METRDSHTQEGKLLDLLERYALEQICLRLPSVSSTSSSASPNSNTSILQPNSYTFICLPGGPKYRIPPYQAYFWCLLPTSNFYVILIVNRGKHSEPFSTNKLRSLDVDIVELGLV